MEFGLFAVVGVIVLGVVGALLAKGKGGCCGSGQDKGSCCGSPEKSDTSIEDSEKEKAINELMSKKDR